MAGKDKGKRKATKPHRLPSSEPPELQELENPVKPTIWPGDFVALRLAKYDDEIPQLAKVEAVNDMDVTIQWWTGRYGDVWTEWKIRGVVMTETVPWNAVIKGSIMLSRSNRMLPPLIKELKSLYQDIEFI